jgi:hypothetical protein
VLGNRNSEAMTMSPVTANFDATRSVAGNACDEQLTSGQGENVATPALSVVRFLAASVILWVTR